MCVPALETGTDHTIHCVFISSLCMYKRLHLACFPGSDYEKF